MVQLTLLFLFWNRDFWFSVAARCSSYLKHVGIGGYNAFMSETRVRYDAGTLVIEGDALVTVPPQFEWDARVEKFRAPAIAREQVLRYLADRSLEVEDASSQARSLDLTLRTEYAPHPYQKEALDAWLKAGGRGSVVLPTGAGVGGGVEV